MSGSGTNDQSDAVQPSPPGSERDLRLEAQIALSQMRIVPRYIWRIGYDQIEAFAGHPIEPVASIMRYVIHFESLGVGLAMAIASTETSTA